MSESATCCPTNIPPVTYDYTAKGKQIVLEKEGITPLPVYTTGTGPTAIIVVYDIFGPSNQSKQLCDKMAESSGYQIIMPDFFRGDPWLIQNYPPSSREEFQGWLSQHGTDPTASHVGTDIDLVHEKLVADGANVGILGLCWGGIIAMVAAASGKYKVAGTAHPAFLTPDKAAQIKCPMILVPAKDDVKTMEGIEETIKTKTQYECQVHWYQNMHHGFCAARGDWSVKEQAEAATEAIGLFVSFFTKYLNQP